MNTQMKIKNIHTIEELTEICAGLVKQGLTFTAMPDGAGWIVYLTGGY